MGHCCACTLAALGPPEQLAPGPSCAPALAGQEPPAVPPPVHGPPAAPASPPLPAPLPPPTPTQTHTHTHRHPLFPSPFPLRRAQEFKALQQHIDELTEEKFMLQVRSCMPSASWLPLAP